MSLSMFNYSDDQHSNTRFIINKKKQTNSNIEQEGENVQTLN